MVDENLKRLVQQADEATDKIDSIKREIAATEELIEDNYKEYRQGNLSYDDYQYVKKMYIQDTYEMIKQILEMEGNE